MPFSSEASDVKKKHSSTPKLNGEEGDKHGWSSASPSNPSKWGLVGPSKSCNPSRDILEKILHQVHVSTIKERDVYELTGLPRNTEIDLVLSGGGLRGYYVCGAYVVLSALIASHGLKIKRFAGTSAGAWNCGA